MKKLIALFIALCVAAPFGSVYAQPTNSAKTGHTAHSSKSTHSKHAKSKASHKKSGKKASHKKSSHKKHQQA